MDRISELNKQRLTRPPSIMAPSPPYPSMDNVLPPVLPRMPSMGPAPAPPLLMRAPSFAAPPPPLDSSNLEFLSSTEPYSGSESYSESYPEESYLPSRQIDMESMEDDDLYLIDSYVSNDLSIILQQIMEHHDQCAPEIDYEMGIYDVNHDVFIPSSIESLSLSIDASLRNGTVIKDQTFIFHISEGHDIKMINNFGSPVSTYKRIYLTQQEVNSNNFITMSLIAPEKEGLTPNWGIWTNQACYFPQPCNITFDFKLISGEVISHTYNLSTAGIGVNTSSLVALPPFKISSGEEIRIIFYLEPYLETNPIANHSLTQNSLQKIIFQIIPQPSTERGFRARLKDRIRHKLFRT